MIKMYYIHRSNVILSIKLVNFLLYKIFVIQIDQNGSSINVWYHTLGFNKSFKYRSHTAHTILKFLKIVYASWLIRKDLKAKYRSKLQKHPNELAKNLLSAQNISHYKDFKESNPKI